MDIRSELFSTQVAHLWLINSSDLPATKDNQLLSLLTPEEQQRYHSLHIAKVRREYLITRSLVRSALSQYANVAAQDWRFVTNAYGRPSLSAEFAGLRIDFNLSHSQGWVACLIACGHQVGVDIESQDRKTCFSDLYDAVFSEYEYDYFQKKSLQENQAQKDFRFLHYWTLKEAYSKALGLGLSLDLKSMTCVFAEDDYVNLVATGLTELPSQRWQLRHVPIAPAHLLAMAIGKSTASDLAIRLIPAMPGSGAAGYLLEAAVVKSRLYLTSKGHGCG